MDFKASIGGDWRLWTECVNVQVMGYGDLRVQAKGVGPTNSMQQTDDRSLA